ncbi:MAG: WhiB family transcriptional regulator [Actinobacteria bacterium]|nr:WhiB family transcriptional regulator [Actinomycetota bacterium]
MKELLMPETEWREQAACLPYPAILFFGMDDNEGAAERHAREEEAKEICTHCVVRAECLDYALATREAYGIWGGLTELERKARLQGRAS